MSLERSGPGLASPTDFAIEDNPEYTDDLKRALRVGYHNKRGVALAGQKAWTAALIEFDIAIKESPTFAEAWFHRGLVLGEQNLFDLAYESFAQAAFLAPNYGNALQRLAAVAPIVGRPAEILTPWATSPPSRIARAFHKLLGHIRPAEHYEQFDPFTAAAEADVRRALAAEPHSAELANKLGLILQSQFRMIEAALLFRYAIMLAPWWASPTINLWTLLELEHRSSEGRSLSAAALRAGSNEPRLYATALWSALVVADWTHYRAWHKRTLKAMKKDPLAGVGYQLWLVDDAEMHFHGACHYSLGYENKVPRIATRFRRSSQRPITLGYISADFRDHPVARLTAELFELHDRKRFRVYGYGTMADTYNSEIGARIRKSFDKYCDVSALSPRAGAQRIADDGVDILIDLTGNMLSGPKSIIPRRPAPIQVNYLGHPGTTGSREMDYIIVDKIIVPREQQKWFTEALIYMPECHQVNDRKRATGSAPKSRTEYGLPEEGVVYCSFNETKKITPDVFEAWMRILARVPGSVLWLASQKTGTADNMRRHVAACGIDTERVIFAERIPNHNDHMSRYRVCDLYLDTLLYNGHTTASDALWVGCPVLTTLGNTYQTRVAASLLDAMGMPEMVAPSLAGYEDLAVRVGHDAAFRAALRAKVETNRLSSPLFDTPRFTRHLEWAFEHMWDAYVDGRSPTAFDVPALPR